MGDIEVNVGNSSGYKGAMFDFNPYNVASGEYDRIERFEIAAKEKLFPIGSMGQAIAYVGNKKNIYFGDWNTFFGMVKILKIICIDYLYQTANLFKFFRLCILLFMFSNLSYPNICMKCNTRSHSSDMLSV